MDSFNSKEEYTISDIQSLIDNAAEESIHLEFKSAPALSKADSVRGEISKDVAAFANSDGGIIVYGVSEDNSHKATSLSFIDGTVYTKEWLEQTIQSNIQRAIDELKILPVRADSDPLKTIYIVKIPASLDAPHMSRDKRYYKRYNFKSVQMEEYEVRNSYGRKKNSLMAIASSRIALGKIDAHSDIDRNSIALDVTVVVANDGDLVEKDFNLNVYFEPAIGGSVVWDRSNSGYTSTIFEDEDGGTRLKVSCPSHAALFPEESRTAARFSLILPLETVRTILTGVKYEIGLYYTGGKDLVDGEFDADFVSAIVSEAEQRLSRYLSE